MQVDSIENGVVIDHIPAGQAMEIYYFLNLDKADCSVAVIKNVRSKKMGKKDIIKIESDKMEVKLDVLGFFDPNITINYIEKDKIVDKKTLKLPERLTNVLYCKNPRCITAAEQDTDSVFRLDNRQAKEYRCVYCDAKSDNIMRR